MTSYANLMANMRAIEFIFTGNFYTQPSGRVYNRMPGADHDDKIAGMERMTDIVHRHSSKICAQLSHAGRQVFQPTAADDPYGGSFENRLRILLDILRAVRERVGEGFPILIKLNGDDALPLRKGLKTSAFVEIAQVLESHGLDAVEISAGHYESGFPAIRGNFNRFFDTLLNEGVGREYPRHEQLKMRLSKGILAALSNWLWPHSEGYNLAYAEQFKRSLKIPVICVGGFSGSKAMEEAINTGQCDAVSIARAMIADPYLVRHIRKKEPSIECRFCSACLASIGTRPVDCFHPEVRTERVLMLERERRLRHGNTD